MTTYKKVILDFKTRGEKMMKFSALIPGVIVKILVIIKGQME